MGGWLENKRIDSHNKSIAKFNQIYRRRIKIKFSTIYDVNVYRLVASIQADRNEAQQNRIKLSQKMKKKKTIKQKTGGCSTHAGWTMSSWHYIAESIRCCIRWQNENRIKKNEDNRRNKSEGNKMIGSNNRCVCHMLKKKMGDWEKKKENLRFRPSSVSCC